MNDVMPDPTTAELAALPRAFAVAADYLARYSGRTREAYTLDLRSFFTWCADRQTDPLHLGRADIERYVRWMQDQQHYAPSTVSRRLSCVCGYYKYAVIDPVLTASPAQHVLRPWASPTCSSKPCSCAHGNSARSPTPWSCCCPCSACV